MSSKLEEKFADLNTECESLKSQLTHSKTEIEIHKAENIELKESSEDLNNQNNSSSEKIQQLTTQVNALKDLTSQYEKVTSTNVILNINIKNLEHNIKQYESQNKELTEQLSEYKLKLSQHDLSNVNNKAIIHTQKQVELKQGNKIQELEDKIQILETQISETQPSHVEEEDTKQYPLKSPPPGFMPALDNPRTLQMKSSENIAKYVMPQNSKIALLSSSIDSTSVTPKGTAKTVSQFVNVVSHNTYMSSNPSAGMVSTATTPGDVERAMGYDIGTMLQRKAIECKKLLEEKEQNEKQIKILQEKCDEDSLRIDYNKLKRENRNLKQQLEKSNDSCFLGGCFSTSWFKDKVETE